MSTDNLKRDTALGLVFFLGLLALLWATAKLGSFSLTEKQVLEVHVPHARGLKVGDNVEFLGTKVGIVSGVETDSGDVNNPVRLSLRLDRRLTLLTDHKIRVSDKSLLGGKVVAIDPGTKGAAANTDQTLIGTAPQNPIEALGDLLGGEANRDNLARILQDVAQVISDLREGKGSIGDTLANARDFFKRADELAVALKDTVAEAREGKGEIGKVITNAATFFEDGTKLIADARTGEGVVAKLLNDKQLAEDVSSTVTSVRTMASDLEAGKGALGKLLRDPDTEKLLDSIIKGIDEAVASVNSGKGILPRLLNDDSLANSVTRIVDNIDSVIADLRAGKGTLGRLFGDDTIANQIERLLNQISRTVEDAREAAPVSTLVTTFFGVFQ
ncbi:MAG: MCE family protein [Planctomycetes bacterium]|nr:MCE family protein [Planctomycetota bacterium]MCB9917282.1 MCE family protein [Planctomycetota bacterium]